MHLEDRWTDFGGGCRGGGDLMIGLIRMPAQILCHPEIIGANMKVRVVGGLALAGAPVESEAGSLTWCGGL